VIKAAVVGIGKMGLSHQAIINAHPEVELAAVCDSSNFVLDVLNKYTGVPTYTSYERMLGEVDLDAVVIATPSRTHAEMIRAAIGRDLAIFCEKPFTLSARDAEELARLSASRDLVTQVGYHNRFVASFREVKGLVDAGVIGTITHALGEAYGPVVLKPKGGTWRSQRNEGGGCLYDYAAHAIDLLNWFLGEPVGVGGTVLRRIFSREIDDQVSGTLYYPEGRTAQVCANWSDESYRRMTTSITIWGTAGSIRADRQECKVYLRDTAPRPAGYEPGWNVRYTTELTEPVGFYLRGEEYSAQIDDFVQRVKARRTEGENRFHSAAITDKVISLMITDAEAGASTSADGDLIEPPPPKRSRRPRLQRLRRNTPG